MFNKLRKKAEKFDGTRFQSECEFAGQYTGLVVGAGGRGTKSVFQGFFQALSCNTLSEVQEKKSKKTDLVSDRTSSAKVGDNEVPPTNDTDVSTESTE